MGETDIYHKQSEDVYMGAAMALLGVRIQDGIGEDGKTLVRT
jgi:hypothetical protein